MIKRLGSPAAAQPIMQPTSQQSVTLTPKALGEFYETILDRFGDEEEKSVNSYQELLIQVQKSKAALGQIQDSVTYDQIAAPLNELERKINKHLNEERVHLDVIDAMQEMFSNMKLGKVY
jgi:two-component SAPR family response regulator